jgi:AraC-like DNA-binding protein
LKFSQWMLSIFPPTKISVIAVLLGYERVQDFNRFFAKHTGQSPSQWGRRKRARIAHNE